MLIEIRERQIVYDITYMWNLNIQEASEYNKTEVESQIQRTNSWFKLVVTSGGRNTRMEEWEVQTIGCKIDPRLYCTT